MIDVAGGEESFCMVSIPTSPRRVAAALMAAALLAAPSAAQSPPERPPARITELAVFAQADLRMSLIEVTAMLRANDIVGAVVRLGQLSRANPTLIDLLLAQAQLLARGGAPDQALAALTRAVDVGLRDADAVAATGDFAVFANNDNFVALLDRMRIEAPLRPLPPQPAPVPAEIKDGVATITETSSGWSNEAQALVTLIAPQPPAPPSVPATKLKGPASDLLNQLVRDGKAAGGRGDIYDNRDNGHSKLPSDASVDMTRIVYGPEAIAANLSRGVKGPHLFGGPTIGNSSTAITGKPFWRSMSRRALTMKGGPDQLYRQYRRNQLYVYPEHKDHDPFFGDLMPAQTPYLLTTQGSSVSDRPMLIGLAMALAALKPEVKADLTARGMIAPALQMLVRRSMKGIETDADYLSPRAHPAVFDAETLDHRRLVAQANALEVGALAPPAALRVISELRPTQRIELFGDAYDERFFDTPHAIARIARGAYGKRMIGVSAAGTTDPEGRPLRFHWRVLSGGAKGVEIKHLSEDGAEVEITFPWQHRLTAPGRADMRTRRLDIMAVSDNGAGLGAPAFVSVLFPSRQVVEFDGEKPISIVYDAASRLDQYEDPLLFPLRRWRDDYSYDADGRLLGWTRTHQGGDIDRFTRHGAIIETRDELGRPLTARQVAYPAGAGEGGVRQVATAPLDASLRYEYDGPEDRLGMAIPVREDG
jgi:hypothetical protein